MTVIRKNRGGNTELKKRAHTKVQIIKIKQMNNTDYTVDLVINKKKRLIYIDEKTWIGQIPTNESKVN